MSAIVIILWAVGALALVVAMGMVLQIRARQTRDLTDYKRGIGAQSGAQSAAFASDLGRRTIDAAQDEWSARSRAEKTDWKIGAIQQCTLALAAMLFGLLRVEGFREDSWIRAGLALAECLCLAVVTIGMFTRSGKTETWILYRARSETLRRESALAAQRAAFGQGPLETEEVDHLLQRVEMSTLPALEAMTLSRLAELHGGGRLPIEKVRSERDPMEATGSGTLGPYLADRLGRESQWARKVSDRWKSRLHARHMAHVSFAFLGCGSTLVVAGLALATVGQPTRWEELVSILVGLAQTGVVGLYAINGISRMELSASSYARTARLLEDVQTGLKEIDGQAAEPRSILARTEQILGFQLLEWITLTSREQLDL